MNANYYTFSGQGASSIRDFVKVYKNLDKKEFYNWLMDKTDMDKKTAKFKDVYSQVYHTVYPYQDIRFDCLPEVI